MVLWRQRYKNMWKQKRIGFWILRTPKGVRSLPQPIPCYMACQAAGLPQAIHQTSVIMQRCPRHNAAIRRPLGLRSHVKKCDIRAPTQAVRSAKPCSKKCNMHTSTQAARSAKTCQESHILKNIPFIEFNLSLSQHLQIFLSERFPCMMFLLLLNIIDNLR